MKKLIIIFSIVLILFIGLVTVMILSDKPSENEKDGIVAEKGVNKLESKNPNIEEEGEKEEKIEELKTNGELEKAIEAIESGKNTIVYFHQEDCHYCKMANPIIESLTEELDVEIYKVDLKYNEKGWEVFKIKGTPSLVHFRQGNEIKRNTGLKSEEEYRSWLTRSSKYD